MPPTCSYFQCKSVVGQKSMFRFPTGDSRRLQTWLDNCGNMTITHLTKDALRNKYICIDHFEKRYIQNEGGKRRRLNKLAVPIHYRGDEFREITTYSSVASTSQAHGSPNLKVLTPTKTYVVKRLEDHAQNEEDTILCQDIYATPRKRKREVEEDTPKCKRLKIIIQGTNKNLKNVKSKYNRLKKKTDNKKIVNLDTKKFRSESSKILTWMQLKKNKNHWTEAEKKFCMSLFYKSPAAYTHLRNQGIVLAAPTTIQNWLQETNCLPGLNDDVFQNISDKFADQTIKEKSCIVCFDEMNIKVDLDYTMKYDLIEGFEDFGGGDRSPKEARYALVFVARGIYSNWKIPLAYFLSPRNVNADKLIMLIRSVINKLFECGLLPKAVVCDQATTNVKAIKSLGATKDDPFFFINNHKIFAVYDVPHLIKNIRNNLIDNNFDLNGNEISFKDITNVYNIDKNNKSKTLKKITPAHLKPNNFQKMRVKLATQVLSHSVAAAIKTTIDSGELKSDTAKYTADFVMIVNDLFDSLNSKNKFDRNPNKCALTNNKKSRVHESLAKGKQLFADLKKKNINKNNKTKLTCPPCFEGMQQSINAVLQLSAEEFSKGAEVKFIMTYRLNQDVIENLFGIYRMRGGCNRNPTAKSLRAMFRSNLLNNLIKLDKTNCETDSETFLSTTANLQKTQPSDGPARVSTNSTNQVEFDDTNQASNSGATTCVDSQTVTPETRPESNITLETCSVVYFAGWLGKVCIEKFDCSMCKQLLINDEVDLLDKKQLLLINKTYSNLITPTLKSPTDFLFELVNQLLDLFNNKLNYIHHINLISNLMDNVRNTISLPDDYHDKSHLNFLIKKLFQVKIHDYCKSRKSSFDSKSKLRILQNK